MSILFLSAAAAVATPTLADPGDQMKCKRESVTGSLMETRKVCHTEREWRTIRNGAEDEARRITRPGSTAIEN